MVLDHLVLNLNTTDDEILMEVKETTDISGFKKARWAMDLIIFSSEPLNEEEKGIEFSTEKSLDDENTPGVFHRTRDKDAFDYAHKFHGNDSIVPTWPSSA
ncbi:putative Lysosomal transcription factor, NCU-G1-containing protein [Homarus americanus]|uniref:Putative Lysosomal transcription factor, NCU-G1-containing protein n=1 Tax=Homarus americanus TaxID=6706 RepID=A0A8J5NB19_HOMAM|nr:putative Lysosomal transcription factor, NCU-G1-containing protein [Homarus americanus]